jgi:hypothetical protein
LALWIRIIFIFHKDKTFVRKYVKGPVLLRCDTVSMDKTFAIFWRKKFAFAFRHWRFQGEPSKNDDGFSSKRRDEQTQLPQRHIHIDANPQKHSWWV